MAASLASRRRQAKVSLTPVIDPSSSTCYLYCLPHSDLIGIVRYSCFICATTRVRFNRRPIRFTDGTETRCTLQSPSVRTHTMASRLLRGSMARRRKPMLALPKPTSDRATPRAATKGLSYSRLDVRRSFLDDETTPTPSRPQFALERFQQQQQPQLD